MNRCITALMAAGPVLWVRAQEDAEHLELIRRNLEQIQADHGLSLALSGMLIVFSGLAGISLFIALLPRVLAKFGSESAEADPGLEAEEEALAVAAARAMAQANGYGAVDPVIWAAISAVVHAEYERHAGQGMKVTLGLHGPSSSSWALSSKMRVIPGRIK